MKITPDIVFTESPKNGYWQVIFKHPGTMTIIETMQVKADVDMPFKVGLKQLEIMRDSDRNPTPALLDDIAAYQFLLKQPEAVKKAYLAHKKIHRLMPVRKVLMAIRK